MSRSQVLGSLIALSLALSGCTASESKEELVAVEVAPTSTTAEKIEESSEEVLPEQTVEAPEQTADVDKPQSPEPKPTQSAPEVILPSTGEKAFLEINRLLDSSHKAQVGTVRAHENIEQAIVDEAIAQISKAASAWDEDYGVISDFELVIFRQESAAWADEIRVSNGDRIGRGTFVNDVKISSSGPHCGFMYILQNRVYSCIPDSGTDGMLGALLPHEYFHALTYELGIDHTNLPIWIAEGLGSYIGDTMYFKSYEAYHSKSQHWRNWNMYERFGHMTLGQFSDRITQDEVNLIYTKLEAFTANDAQQLMQDYPAYQFGAVAAENLIGSFGIDTMMSFLEAVGSGQYWKSAFEKYYGQTVPEFYVDMLSYIQENY